MAALPTEFAATRPTSRYPPCAMLEYASMRFRLLCATPTTVPRIIVAAATQATSGAQSVLKGSNAERNTRVKAANAATLTPVDMNPVTMAGAPSYASGVHMWNGTAEILKANPTSSSPTASRIIGLSLSACADRNEPTASSLVLPATPYVNAIP